jgi:hypothetical protein
MSGPRPPDRPRLGPEQHEPRDMDALGVSVLPTGVMPPPRRSGEPSNRSHHTMHTMLGLIGLIMLEMVFVIALLMVTQCTRWEAVQTAAAVTVVSTSCFYARNAFVAIGRRLFAPNSGGPGPETRGHDWPSRRSPR